MTEEDVVDTMGDNTLQVMELKNDKICDDSDSICGEEHKMDNGTYSLSDTLEKQLQR